MLSDALNLVALLKLVELDLERLLEVVRPEVGGASAEANADRTVVDPVEGHVGFDVLAVLSRLVILHLFPVVDVQEVEPDRVEDVVVEHSLALGRSGTESAKEDGREEEGRDAREGEHHRGSAEALEVDGHADTARRVAL